MTITAQDVNELDPNKKGKDYCLRNSKHLHTANTGGVAINFYNQKAKWQLNKKYARGEQPIDNVKRLMRRDKTLNWDSLNWSVPKIMPKIFDIMVGIVEKLSMEISCTSIDPDSVDKKIVAQYKKEAEILLANEIEQLEQLIGSALRDPSNQYTDVEQLQMDIEDGSFKLDLEIAMEEVIDCVFDYNKLRQLRPDLTRDAANCGMIALRHYVQSNGLIKVRRVNPIYFASDYVQTKDFRDMGRCGEYVFLNMQELRQQAGRELSDIDYITIAEKVQGKYGNPNFAVVGTNITSYVNPSGNGYVWDKFIVCVLYNEWVTTNRYNHIVDKPNMAGNPKTIAVKHTEYSPDNRNKEFHKATDYKMWYKNNWIVDTDFCYDYGPLEFPNVKTNAMNESASTFAVEAIQIEDMITSTYTERVLAIMDTVFINFMQMQSFLAKAIPPGVYAEMFALSNISNGKGGQTFKPLELLEGYAQTGNMVGNSLLPNGQIMQRAPIELLQGSDLTKINFFWTQIIQGIDLIKEVIGLNDFTDASNPNPEQSVGGAKLAVAATQNSLRPLVSTIDNVFEKVAEGIVNRAQHMASLGQLDYMANAIGRKKLLALSVSSELSSAAFGIKIEPRMDDQEKAYLEQNIQQSLAQRSQTGSGGIEIEDAIAIRRCKNIKAAEKMLIFRRKKRREEDSKKSAELQDQNAMVQERGAAASTKGAMEIAAQDLEIYKQKKEIDFEYKKRELALQTEGKNMNIEVQGEVDKDLTILESQLQPTTGGDK